MSFRPRTFAEMAQNWPPDLDHVSASSLTMFARCPEQWRQRYCLGKISPPAAATIIGRADHHAIATNFEQKIESHDDLPVNEVLDVYLDTFDDQLEMSGGPTEIDFGKKRLTGEDAKKAAGKAKDDGAAIVSTYSASVAPSVQPTGVELRFHVETPELPVRIDGYIDVETAEGLIERKTGRRSMSEPAPDWIIQARLYQLAKPRPLQWHLSVMKKEPEVVMLPQAHDERRSRTALGLAQQSIRTIGFFYSLYGPEQAWPGALTHPWACGYCAYKPSCPWHV